MSAARTMLLHLYIHQIEKLFVEQFKYIITYSSKGMSGK